MTDRSAPVRPEYEAGRAAEAPGGSLGAPGDSPGHRDETEDERWDRNYGDLLQEIRVAQTGVQILFAFLITLPFAARFGETSTRDHVVYIVTLLAAAAASALLIAPVSYHRMNFRKGRKAELVVLASRLATVGVGCLMVSLTGAVFVVIDVMLGLIPAVLLTLVVLALCAYLWFIMPVVSPSVDWLTARKSGRPPN